MKQSVKKQQTLVTHPKNMQTKEVDIKSIAAETIAEMQNKVPILSDQAFKKLEVYQTHRLQSLKNPIITLTQVCG